MLELKSISKTFKSNINYWALLSDWELYSNKIGIGNNNETNKKIKNLKKKGELKFHFESKSKKADILSFIIQHKYKKNTNSKKQIILVKIPHTPKPIIPKNKNICKT